MQPWRFYNRKDPEAVRERQQVLDRIDRWWAAFRATIGDFEALFASKKQWDLAAWMQEHLHAVDPALMWEFAAHPDGGHHLVITPEGQRHLRPLVDTILERAPQVPGWRFFAYRQPETPEMVIEAVKAKTGNDFTGITAYGCIGELQRVDLTYQVPAASGPDDDEALRDAFLATEALLGEELLDKWVGQITVVPELHGKRLLPFERFQTTVAALVRSIQDRLPEETYAERTEGAEWSLVQLEPEESDDYPGKADLITCITMNVDWFRATHTGAPFYSERFSRRGEKFAFVKIDGSDVEDMRFGDREEIENAIDEALRSAHAGGVIGGGTGLRYSYADLALTDVDGGIAAVRRALQAGNVPRRSWLLFYDAEWQREWVGVWDNSPPPPLPELDD